MKFNNILKAAAAILATFALSVSCTEKEFEEITDLNLSRCLEPQNLEAKVDVLTGDYVTFSWDVNKDADAYNLVVYTDEAMTAEALNTTIDASDVPYTVRLTADEKYWFKVQAISGSRAASNWAVFDGSCKTYAVKDNLFLEVTGRTANSISLSWSSAPADYTEVTHISATPVKGGDAVTHELTADEKEAAAATVEGLNASTEYQVVLFYMSASRGAQDIWTIGSSDDMTVISDPTALKTALIDGGNIYLKPGEYDLVSITSVGGSTIKPAASIKLVGADGSKPVVHLGKFELTGATAAGSDLYFEGIKFDGDGSNSRIVEHTADVITIGSVKFVNCEITNYQAGLFYDNKDELATIGELSFDSCDIYNILGSGGDCVDIRKPCEITTMAFRNNTIYDGIRTMFRIDANDAVKIGTLVFENNTVKNIATMDDGNNRGFFAIRVATQMSLKKNIFLWEDGGKTGEDVDKAQLFQDNGSTVEPTFTAAADNYAYGCGKDFFKKISAATAGFTVLDADPCYNSKGNFFHLANQDLISKKAGASKWWISYVERDEDLTQNVLEGAHTWNLQDASLFAGEVKNSRVRDELLLVGTEAIPMNADGGINFLSASELSKKGIPTAGYAAFKVNTPGSVDLLLSDPDKTGASVVVALFDDNGLSVLGGAVASASNPEVQKIVVKAVSGEGTIYLYSTGKVSVTKLAWSLDTIAGNKVLPTPKPTVEPVTVTEGDATAITVTWDAVPNAETYVVVFNKRAADAQTETSFTVAAEDIAELKAGLYNFTVQAFPRKDDIYYVKSEQGAASLAIQPKGGAGESVEVDLVWDFSAADWQEQLAAVETINTDHTDWNLTYDGMTFFSSTKSKFNTTFIQFGGSGVNGTTGELDRYLKFTAPEQGTLKITCSNTGSSVDMTRMIRVYEGAEYTEQAGGFASTSPETLEFSVKAGEIKITTTAGLRVYKVEFIYTTSGAAAIEYNWDFSAADWQEKLAAVETINTDHTDWNLTYDGLTFFSSSKSKFNTTFIQFGGSGVNGTTGELDRYLKFTAPEQGTLKITCSNTGSSVDMTRMIRVYEGAEYTEQAGGFASTAPETLEFSVKAGEIKITTTAGLRVYSVYYTNK